MRKFIHRVKDLSQKAAEVKQQLQSMPGKAAELREAVVMSAGELQQIRSDVHANLNGLRANSEDRLLQAMREINDHTYTFEEAGYELTGMDLDLAITQRLAVHFQKFEEVSHSTLRALLSKQTRETVKAILSGIIKAEEIAANVELTHLKYDGVIVDVGAIPMIRMAWRSDTFTEQQETVIETAQPGATPGSSLASTPPISASPSIGSFFEQRTIPISSPSATLTTQSQVSSQAADSPSATVPLESHPAPEKPNPAHNPDWKQGALDRFKKMPDLSKRF
jgi:hypothetical protein